ncbi:IclR family transcriptional regulator [Rhodococcus sp. NPDC055024]
MDNDDSGPRGTRAVDRAFTLLSHVADEGPVSLSELARNQGLPVSTTKRLLGAMEQHGYIYRDDDGHYVAGRRLAPPQDHRHPRPDLVAESGKALQSLTDETMESSYLGVMGGAGDVIYVRQVESPLDIRHVGWVGRSVPLASSAAGNALLGRLGPDGYSVKRATLTEGATAVAAPVRDSSGRIVGSLSIVGPSFRLQEKKIEQYGKATKNHADALSQRLGARISEVDHTVSQSADFP